SNATIFCITRYGNVLASRGSVVPLFIDQIRAGQPLTITDPNMTRFMMTLDDAVDLVMYAFDRGKPGETYVQKAPAATIGTLGRAMSEILGAPDHPVEIIGTRHGEKLFEVLLRREEMVSAQDQGNYYLIPPDLRDLRHDKYVEQGEIRISQALDYSSHDAKRLDIEGMKALLMRLPFIQGIARGENALPED
ncbi:MAG: polysaccharide biosynthesis protein, partial [Burkholderiales bacterium]